MPAEAAKEVFGPGEFIIGYYALSLPRRAAEDRKCLSKGNMVRAGQFYVPPNIAVYCSCCCHAAATPSKSDPNLEIVPRMNDILSSFVKVAFEVRFIFVLPVVRPVRILLVPVIKHYLPLRLCQLRFPE